MKMLINIYCIILLIICILSSKIKGICCTAAGQETLIGIKGKDFVMLAADSSTSGSGGISFTSNSVDKIHEIILPEKNTDGQQAIIVASAGDIADCDYMNGILSSHAKIREFESSLGSDVKFVFHGESGEDNLHSNLGLDASNIAHLARSEISYRLRSPSPLRVNLLIAGMLPYVSDYHRITTKDSTTSTTNESLLSKRINTQVTKALKEKIPQNKKDSQTNKVPNPNLKPQLHWLDEYGSNQKNIPYSVHGYASNFALSILDQNYKMNMNKEDVLLLIKDCFAQLRDRYIINTGSSSGGNAKGKICVKCVDCYGVSTFEI